jgi:putative NADH-flavin reductase
LRLLPLFYNSPFNRSITFGSSLDLLNIIVMKIVIFGATGSVGKHLVRQSLELGHEVTAFVRDAHKIASADKKIRIRTGDVLDAQQVSDAIVNQDVVLCALGAGRKGKVRSQGTYNIIQAMETRGVKRLICETTLGCGDSRGNLNFVWKHIMFGWFLKKAYEDHQLQEKHIFKSDLDWTIIRPAAFTNGPLTKKYRYGFPPTEKSITLKISRADLAHFMLQQLDKEASLKKCISLSY